MELLENFKDYRLKQLIRKVFRYIFTEKKLMNSKEEYPVILDIQFNEFGFTTDINISTICGYEEFEKHLDYIKALFKAYEVEFNVVGGTVRLYIQTDELIDKQYKKVILEPYELLLGYNHKQLITVDMRITPHLLISGLSGQGKTECAKTIVTNLDGADIAIVNGFLKDFKGIQATFINGEDNILKFFRKLLECNIECSRPLYVVIDELLVLSKNKDINKAIQDLLAVGRHMGAGVFVIGIAQEATKENLKYKSLFNARCTFKQIEESSYRVVLGVGVDRDLQKRGFYLYSDSLYRGKTFINKLIDN